MPSMRKPPIREKYPDEVLAIEESGTRTISTLTFGTDQRGGKGPAAGPAPGEAAFPIAPDGGLPRDPKPLALTLPAFAATGLSRSHAGIFAAP